MFKKLALIGALFSVIGIAQGKQFLDQVVAVVNEGVITSSELEKQVAISKSQISAQKMEMPKETILRKQVLDHLIDIDLQLQMAKQTGITVDDKELNEAIERIASINKITLAQLREEIKKQGLSWEEYKKNIHKELLINQLQQKNVGKDIIITNEQVAQYLKSGVAIDRSKFTYHVQNIVVPLNEKPTPLEIQKAKIQAEKLLAKVNKGSDFIRLPLEESNNEWILEGGDLGVRHLTELPEIFAKAIINMKAGQTAGPLRTDNGFQLIKLVAIGGDNQKHIVTQTHVRHILLKPAANMLPAEAMNQVNNIYQQIKSGKDFSVMAKHYSVDSSSAVKGGDLGWVNPGELVPEFENTMNKLPLHTLSKPVKTVFGWHLIEVLERKQKDDSEAFKQQQVRQYLYQRKFADALQSWQQHLRAQAYVNILEKNLA